MSKKQRHSQIVLTLFIYFRSLLTFFLPYARIKSLCARKRRRNVCKQRGPLRNLKRPALHFSESIRHFCLLRHQKQIEIHVAGNAIDHPGAGILQAVEVIKKFRCRAVLRKPENIVLQIAQIKVCISIRLVEVNARRIPGGLHRLAEGNCALRQRQAIRREQRSCLKTSNAWVCAMRL